MEYRIADMRDIQTLVDFRKRQLIDEGQIPNINIDQSLTEYFYRNLSENTLVQCIAMENGEPVATGGVHFYCYPPSFTNATGKQAYIANLYTMPDFRGKGIAKTILNLLIEEAESRAYHTVCLQASAQGYPLYKQYGFVDIGGFMKFDKNM
ncbi:MAG: GNAT family N-acetyltransferase [Defluviitaleaceae bacterium]|nr:GNAT family N-acetyltransferase [Defluviitaleaceae bacterium]